MATLNELGRYAAYVHHTSGSFSRGAYVGAVVWMIVGFVALMWWLVNLWL